MSLLLALARLWVPGAIKRQKLREWFELTARGFKAEPPDLNNFSYQETLRFYAKFTAVQARRVLRASRSITATRKRLSNLAWEYGRDLRQQFGVKTMPEALRLGKLLYRLIGIELQAPDPGHLAITRCFFREYYTPDICRLMSALDEGVLTGLSGCKTLKFTRRLTEGHLQCRAQLL
jgi:hypothetical protein